MSKPRVIPFEKSFASSDKAQFWSSKNELKPEEVYKSTKSKYLFDCKCGHCFDCSLDNVKRGNWCPYCANKKLCGLNDCKQCYDKSFASIDKANHWSDKNRDQPEGYDGLYVSPRQLLKSSDKKYWFDCNKCGHTFDCSLNSITTNGNWCRYCANQALCVLNDCKICFEKSFASIDNAKYWSDKNTFKPREVFKSSHSICWFDCECGHTFYCSLNNIARVGCWCGYCSNPPKRLCDDSNCEKCFNNSFASSDNAKYWSNKNELKPREVFKSSSSICWFDCECGHTFYCNLNSITGKCNWCGYCSNPPNRLCDDSNCEQCFNNSFASSDKVIYWSRKNVFKPREVFKSSNDKYWFKCVKGHNFDSTLSHITYGRWCPYCVNKTEQILYDKLIIHYPSLQQQFKSDWCQNKRFDFVIPEYNTIIELDGPQHFIQISNWASPEETQKNDKYKTECANKNNYSVIRLLQEDVFYNTYNWLDELNQNIQKIISEGITQNIYMCKNCEYCVDVL